jgi:NitT/TauT family transport system substrate-binding protein
MAKINLTRRSFVGGVSALVAMPGIVRAQLKPARTVTFLSDWIHNGPNSGFPIAIEKGFYSAEGLTVTINQGKGSGSTAQIVGSKAAQFGFADGYVVGNSVSKGMKIKTVASVFRKNPAAVIVMEDSPIREPKDLIGKTIGISTGAAQFQQWPAFVKGANLSADQVRVVNVDPAGAGPALILGKVDAIAGFAQGYVPGIEVQAKKKCRLFWYADYGATSVSNGIIVHEDMLKEQDLVRSFVRASLRGFLYGRANPDELAQVVKKYSPSVDPEVTKRQAEFSWQTWVTPNTKGKPLGWSSDEDWKKTVETLKAYGGVTDPLEASQIYTNDFVPDGAEFVPPQDA